LEVSAMNSESVLARYFACAAGVDCEDAWIASGLARIEASISYGDWRQARESCECFLVDMEGHFAFEELVIARIGFRSGNSHRNHHAAGLSVIRDLLLDLSGADMTGHGDATRLLAKLIEFGRHVKKHVAQDDQLLCRHAVHVLGATAA
jgi:hemerythrin